MITVHHALRGASRAHPSFFVVNQQELLHSADLCHELAQERDASFVLEAYGSLMKSRLLWYLIPVCS